MMINKAILVGNLGADPEKRHTQGGAQVTTFSVATTERFKNKAGEMQENTEWHRIVTWNRLADICGEYLRKGSKVYIEGKIQTRSWEHEGVKRYTTEIVAREMKMLSARNESSGNSGQNNEWPEEPQGGGTGDDLPF
jgi:single-strand DNA-binding protein